MNDVGNILEINDSNFETEVLGSDNFLLLKLGADWCAPCKKQQTILDKMLVSGKFDQVRFAKMDIDDAPQITSKLKIKSVPTIILFKGGKVLFQKIGLIPELDLSNKILEHISATE